MRLRIHGGTLVTESGLHDADLVCLDGVIDAVVRPSSSVDVDEVYDARGQFVFPGFIDPHVHSRDPGNTEKETFEHSTLGALCGGITTVFEMPNAVPAVADLATFESRRALHEPRAWVNFGLWGLALGAQNQSELAGLFRAGAVGVKLFWGYALDKQTKGLVYNFADADPDELLLPPENGEILAMMREVGRLGGLLAAHCEDRHILAAAAAELGKPIESYAEELAARPAIAEAASISLGAELARAAGCRFHVVHMASKQGAAAVRAAQRAGAPITAESCPQYLTLTDQDADRLGPMIKVYPPVRGQDDQDALWEAVQDGTVSSVGSDHAPHLVAEKMVGFASAPAGGLGVETLGPLMVDAMCRGKISPARLAEVLSTGTARLYGVHPRKGSISVGADADLTIVDPAADHVVSNAQLHALNPVSAWDGWQLKGRIVASVLAGRVAMRDNEAVGARRGSFVAARHRPRGE